MLRRPWANYLFGKLRCDDSSSPGGAVVTRRQSTGIARLADHPNPRSSSQAGPSLLSGGAGRDLTPSNNNTNVSTTIVPRLRDYASPSRPRRPRDQRPLMSLAIPPAAADDFATHPSISAQARSTLQNRESSKILLRGLGGWSVVVRRSKPVSHHQFSTEPLAKGHADTTSPTLCGGTRDHFPADDALLR